MVDDIHLINNILTIKSRNKLVEELQHLLVDGSTISAFYGRSFTPGRQTHPTLHLHSNFKQLGEDITTQVVRCLGRKMKMVKMWGKWSNGKKDHMNWHNHLPYDYSVVYYLKVPLFMKNGTLFEKRLDDNLSTLSKEVADAVKDKSDAPSSASKKSSKARKK